MTDYEKTRAAENVILTADICGSHCEVVEIDGEILLYIDGHFSGNLFEEESEDDYISQINEIL
jgi:hypothetical protein